MRLFSMNFKMLLPNRNNVSLISILFISIVTIAGDSV